jgi:hypothetical protein
VIVRLLLSVCVFGAVALADSVDFFEKRVRPILANHCLSCHGSAKQFANLRLDSRERILKGGDRGPAAIAGNTTDSLILKAVRHEGIQMPMGGKLKPDEIASLEQWVRDGLPWPVEKTTTLAAGDAGFYEKILREHWAFQPVQNPSLPSGVETSPIDRFIGTKLREHGIAKAQRAEREVLARRLSQVLTGLPLSRTEVQGFLQDKSPAAYEGLVDRLLASPHFGEHWARHWMDLMRYAETYGYEWNYEIQGAWRYRDYLIRAFNADLPYDQFVREHIAGDLLTKPRVQEGKWNESVIATAFYRLGEMGHDNCNQFPEIRTDVVDNQIDTLTKAFQGLTVSCARCHDHKIDPIPTEDYYSLYGILNSSRPVTKSLEIEGPAPAAKRKLDGLKAQIKSAIGAAWLKQTSQFGRYLRAAMDWETDSASAARSGQELEPDRVSKIQKLLRRTKLDLHDPLYPAITWMGKPSGEEWSKLAQKYRTEADSRRKFNAETFTTFADFRSALPSGWDGDGWGLRSGFTKNGGFAIATEGGDALSGIYPSGLYTHLLSDRLSGVLRSPILPKDKKFLTLESVGGKLGAVRLVMDGCVIGEDHYLLRGTSPEWVRVPAKSEQPLPTYLEIATKSNNPRLPERPEKFNDLQEEQYASPRSFWGVTRILLHDVEATPQAELGHMLTLMEGPTPKSIAEFATRMEVRIQQALQNWVDDKASAEDIVWIDWLLKNDLITNSRNQSQTLRTLTDAYRAAEAAVPEAAVVTSMADIDQGRDYPILQGGQYQSPGKVAPRHFLSLMPAGLRTVNQAQSGRLEMAEAIANKNNPLTSRVMANRIWHHVFGRGLVATTDNLGRYGEAPTHPELLDYLATRFVTDGWSMKGLIKLMVMSETFQQASEADPRTVAADAGNRLWSRYPLRRMEAESVRDSILAVAGSLRRELFGPSIQPYRDEAKPYRRLFQGPLDGEGRRSVYLKITRMQGPRFLETFDFPAPLQTRGNRDVTNVPSQSLALLNDPFVVSQAKAWGARLVSDGSKTIDERLQGIFETAFSRRASAAELTRFQSLIQALAKERGIDASRLLSDGLLWKDVVHAVFNMKEFVYLR